MKTHFNSGFDKQNIIGRVYVYIMHLYKKNVSPCEIVMWSPSWKCGFSQGAVVCSHTKITRPRASVPKRIYSI
mgnify:FL=1